MWWFIWMYLTNYEVPYKYKINFSHKGRTSANLLNLEEKAQGPGQMLWLPGSMDQADGQVHNCQSHWPSALDQETCGAGRHTIIWKSPSERRLKVDFQLWLLNLSQKQRKSACMHMFKANNSLNGWLWKSWEQIIRKPQRVFIGSGAKGITSGG